MRVRRTCSKKSHRAASTSARTAATAPSGRRNSGVSSFRRYGNRQHEEPGAEPQEPRTRERGQLDEEEEREHERERDLQPVTLLEPEVQRSQHEQRDHELDPQMVRVAGERIRPEDALAADRPVDVDLARTARDRREHGLVEVDPEHLRRAELDDSVDRVRHEARDEHRERRPVEPLAPPDEVGDPDDEEEEVEHELEHPLRPLGERLVGLEVVEADQVDGEERRGRRGPRRPLPTRASGRRCRASCRRTRSGRPR